MKTFIVLFVIAVSLPSEAQTVSVRENVKSKVEVVHVDVPVTEEQQPKEAPKDVSKGQEKKADAAVQKQ